MHTVAFFHGFVRDAAEAGMSEAEIENLVLFLSENPDAGVEIVGTGGCRKLRIAGRGRGKSGGFRVVTFYSGVHIPLFLLTVFAKGEKDNLTKAERNDLHLITKAIVHEYRQRAAAASKKKGT